MKKFSTLLKTLLVGLFACGAMSAWAQTTTTYDFEDGNILFTQDSRITATIVQGTQEIYNESFTIDGKAVYFTGAGNAQNGYCFAHFDFSGLCKKAASVKVEFETVLGNGARSRISIGDALVRGNTGNSSKTTYSNKGAIFMLGSEKNVGYINGTNNADLLTALTQKWLKVTIEVDEIEKTYTYSIVDKATEVELYNNGEKPIAFWSSDATNCTQIDVFGYINSSKIGLIDNLSITVTKDDREQADYTVNFFDSNNGAIKESVTRSGAVGDAIVLIPADKEPLWNSDHSQKYFYQSDNTEGLKISAEGTVVNIYYRDAEIYNYSLVDNFGNVITTGTGYEGENATAAYPRYSLIDGVFYEASTNAKEYRKNILLSQNEATGTITYSEVGNVNTIFYTEGEDIEGMTVATNDNIPVRASNAKAAVSGEDVIITTLPAGKYKLHAGIFSSKSSVNGLVVNFGVGSETFAAALANVNLNEIASDEYELYSETAISYLASSSGDTQFDYIWIEKTGDVEVPTSTSATIGSNGFATFASKYAVDFSETELKAYKATISDDGERVNFTEVTGAVRANTGLLIEGTANESYTIPVVASGEGISGNDFKVNTSGSTFSPAENTTYFAMVKDSDPLTFGTVNPETVAIPANKAYLAVTNASASRMTVTFNSETTGIKTIESSTDTKAIYNLNGQRIKKTQKGLYIMNGKKAIVK